MRRRWLPTRKPSVTGFQLQPGELIEGTVKRADVQKFEGFTHTITVRGPSFRQVYVSDQQGEFRFWVPKGTYSLSVLDAKSVGLNQMRRELGYAVKSAEKPLVLDGVVAGGPKVQITDTVQIIESPVLLRRNGK